MVRTISLIAGLWLITLAASCTLFSRNESVGRPTQTVATPTSGPVVIRFHRQGGIAGLCDDMTIHADGVIEYHTCGRPVQTATLTHTERQDLSTWLDEHSGFTFKQEDNPGRPDDLVRELEFAGQGTAPATDERKQMLLSWVERIYGELVEQPPPGSAVSTAGQVLDVMNKQVIVIVPDEPGHDMIAITPETKFEFEGGGSAGLADVRPGTRISVQGKVLGAGGLQAETVIIQRSGD